VKRAPNPTDDTGRALDQSDEPTKCDSCDARQEIANLTRSSIPCPACGRWIDPEPRARA